MLHSQPGQMLRPYVAYHGQSRDTPCVNRERSAWKLLSELYLPSLPASFFSLFISPILAGLTLLHCLICYPPLILNCCKVVSVPLILLRLQRHATLTCLGVVVLTPRLLSSRPMAQSLQPPNMSTRTVASENVALLLATCHHLPPASILIVA